MTVPAFLRALPAARRGVALIEFAIGLPILLLIGCAGLETANFVLVHLRVSQIALTTADNAARVRIKIDESDVNQLFEGDREIGSAIHFKERGRVILSSLMPNEKGNGQWINWQRCFGDLDEESRYGDEGTGEDNDSLKYMGTSSRRIAAAPDTAVMFVEVTYRYQSVFPNSPLDGQIVNYESAMNVRERTDQKISNVAGSTPATC